MFPILQALAGFLMICGALLCVLGLISLPIERNYKRKHGPIPMTARLLLYGGFALVSVVLAVPLKLLVFKSRKPAPKISYLTELRTKSHDSRKASFDKTRAINEKRSEVTRVLQERYQLGSRPD